MEGKTMEGKTMEGKMEGGSDKKMEEK